MFYNKDVLKLIYEWTKLTEYIQCCSNKPLELLSICTKTIYKLDFYIFRMWIVLAKAKLATVLCLVVMLFQVVFSILLYSCVLLWMSNVNLKTPQNKYTYKSFVHILYTVVAKSNVRPRKIDIFTLYLNIIKKACYRFCKRIV